ncbi:MAG: type II secretion system major pseudopilin GspG [Gammaproteobacteria bacterium]
MNMFNRRPRGIRRPKRSLHLGLRQIEITGASGTEHEDGFTLIEILVVITIIGLLMSLVGPRVLNYLSESKVKAAAIQIQSFGNSLDLFYLDLGHYPTSSQGLAALVQRPGGETGWNGPYLQKGYVPNDPWGHPYRYRSPSEHGPYEIVSLGSSGREGGTGTAVAIKSWERR